jgi:PQQ-dependent catabolism-associated CXXCW motif protein
MNSMSRFLSVGAALLLLGLTALDAAAADNSFSGAQAGSGRRCYFGECEDTRPPPPSPGQQPAPVPALPTPAPQQRPPQQQSQSSYPTNLPMPGPSANLADEFTEYRVPPQPFLQFNVSNPTPTAIPGGRIVTTEQLREAILGGRRQFLLLDAWYDFNHQSLPGALHLPYSGSPGDFNDMVQAQLWQQLYQLTGGNPGYPLVFFCAGSGCWESYNAALRAIYMGYSNVYWYRGGVASWRAANLPLMWPVS